MLTAAIVGWYGADRAMHPAREHDAAALQGYAFAAVTQTVSFASRDGTPLAGWFVPGAGHGGAFAADPATYAQRVLAFYQQHL